MARSSDPTEVTRERRPVGASPAAHRLECGGWYKALGIHLRHSHQLDPREYQRVHELPSSHGLVAGQTRALMSQLRTGWGQTRGPPSGHPLPVRATSRCLARQAASASVVPLAISSQK